MPFIANTHTESSKLSTIITKIYAEAKKIIRDHVNANDNDILICSDCGMTGVINKFQRILGIKAHESWYKYLTLKDIDRPVVFISHMEHHSNQLTWLETVADVEIIPPDNKGNFSITNLQESLIKFKNRKYKIASITACSNVTGILIDYYAVAKLMHSYNGYCFVDFSASAPYVKIDMHPTTRLTYLDAIFYSVHKFLGGPGSIGVLIFNRNLYHNYAPDNPGGGTVDWTNPWGGYKYCDSIEVKEQGGTPPILQTIKAAMCHKLKEEMGVENILEREKEILSLLWKRLSKIDNLKILREDEPNRLGIVSFYINNLHYDLGVRILSDRFGIQVRGGCSCAGTYGHYLLNINKEKSLEITNLIDQGDFSEKPGWIRLSIHQTMTQNEIKKIITAIELLALHHRKWSKEYAYNKKQNHFVYLGNKKNDINAFKKIFYAQYY